MKEMLKMTNNYANISFLYDFAFLDCYVQLSSISSILIELTIESLAVSRISPPTISSSKIPYTLLKLKTISSSQTLPKY